MYSSDTQVEAKHIPLLQPETDLGDYSRESKSDKETLIAEIERIHHEQVIAAIEQLHVEELEIELSQLKWSSLHKLQQLLKQQNYPYAIAYIDSLAQRLPNDPQVREWQASAYLRWGRHVSKEKDLKKAKSCFKKALSILPKGSTLQSQVQQEFHRLSKL